MGEVAVKSEPGREERGVVEVLAGLAEWVCASRRCVATAVCLRAESLGDHGGAWKVTLNTAGDAFTFADLRGLARGAVVGSVMRESSAFLRPYLVKCTSAAASITFCPLGTEEAPLLGAGSEVHMGNELVFCFAGVAREQRPSHIALWRELQQSDAAPNVFLRATVDGAPVEWGTPVASAATVCWVGRSSYARLHLALFADSASLGCASLALFNGRASLTAHPDPSLGAALANGLTRGNLATRIERDALRHWRSVGEWRDAEQTALHQEHALVIAVRLFDHDGSELDGTLLAPDWDERIAKSALAATLALRANFAKQLRIRKRREEREAVQQTLAGQVGLLIQAIVARGRAPFARDAMAHVAEMAFHGETVAETVARVIRESPD